MKATNSTSSGQQKNGSFSKNQFPKIINRLTSRQSCISCTVAFSLNFTPVGRTNKRSRRLVTTIYCGGIDDRRTDVPEPNAWMLTYRLERDLKPWPGRNHPTWSLPLQGVKGDSDPVVSIVLLVLRVSSWCCYDCVVRSVWLLAVAAQIVDCVLAWRKTLKTFFPLFSLFL